MMLIRKAVPSDLTSINEIYNNAVAQGFTGHTVPITYEERLNWFHAHDSDSSLILVAVINIQIAGWVSLSAYRPGRQALKNTAEISYYVADDHKKKGIGAMLIHEAINTARLLGITNLVAIILENNIASIRLIEKAGFAQWGFLPGVANFNGLLCGHFYYGLKILL